jgi:hypothetical protein
MILIADRDRMESAWVPREFGRKHIADAAPVAGNVAVPVVDGRS